LQGQTPQDFKDVNIVHLYKPKANRQLCEHHREDLHSILFNRVNGYLEQSLLPEHQCGFRRHRGTTDMIFAARQLQEMWLPPTPRNNRYDLCRPPATRESQDRGTTDMIFAARQLQEKCQEMRTQT
ncbi:unnamed protein product, partial [Schistocephalus solidus]|uniref:Reverse transcriptase domain-containing protein n=1 Tax=Schistocephalus solidus TaxID=70667 RepID=A0A183SCJ0_SCHSO